jgi:4-amino-4-deoxy-L-arabinose transferase-like glycosyltransferase
MPGFPALLGLVIRFCGSDSLLLTRLVLAVVGTIACYLVYLLGSRLHSPPIGLAAATACALSPTLVGFSVLVLSETLFAVFLLACLLGIDSLRNSETELEHRPRWTAAAWAGLAGCAAVYVRPGWLAALPMLAILWIAMSARRRRATVEMTVLLLVCAIGLLPWAWRNMQVTGHPIVTTLWVGPSLYDGLHQGATGESDMRFIIDDGLFADAEQTEVAIDQHYRAAAWDFAISHPGTTLRLAAIKCWRYLKPWPSASQFQSTWQVATVAVPTVLLYVLAFRGAVSHRHEPRTWILAAFPLLYFAALHTIFVGSLRYRVPAEYSLWILAAIGCRRRTST